MELASEVSTLTDMSDSEIDSLLDPHYNEQSTAHGSSHHDAADRRPGALPSKPPDTSARSPVSQRRPTPARFLSISPPRMQLMKVTASRQDDRMDIDDDPRVDKPIIHKSSPPINTQYKPITSYHQSRPEYHLQPPKHSSSTGTENRQGSSTRTDRSIATMSRKHLRRVSASKFTMPDTNGAKQSNMAQDTSISSSTASSQQSLQPDPRIHHSSLAPTISDGNNDLLPSTQPHSKNPSAIFVLHIIHTTPDGSAHKDHYFTSLQRLKEHAEKLALTVAQSLDIDVWPEIVDGDGSLKPKPGWQRLLYNIPLPENLHVSFTDLAMYGMGIDGSDVGYPQIRVTHDHLYKSLKEDAEEEDTEDNSGKFESWESWVEIAEVLS
ncbi:hypothetical protein ABW21_db0202292 [Orbilia brochopaga]|nr:hypothetical protein ABW21_db0202292 [Drechslerella brochopaga]